MGGFLPLLDWRVVPRFQPLVISQLRRLVWCQGNGIIWFRQRFADEVIYRPSARPPRHVEGELGRSWAGIGAELRRCWGGIGMDLGWSWGGIGAELGRSWGGSGAELGWNRGGIGAASQLGNPMESWRIPRKSQGCPTNPRESMRILGNPRESQGNPRGKKLLALESQEFPALECQEFLALESVKTPKTLKIL